MTPNEVISLLGALAATVIALGLFISGAFWLSRTENKAIQTAKEIGELEAKVSELEKRVAAHGATDIAIAKLETTLNITLAQFAATLNEIKVELKALKDR